jgi:hypothetical protein
MQRSALDLLAECEARSIDVFRYGADLPAMARIEAERNLWAVRFNYLHILHGGLCLRPPWSMVDHFGFDVRATNAAGGHRWAVPELRAAPPLPARWPEPRENPACPALWQRACGARPRRGDALRARARRLLARLRGA